MSAHQTAILRVVSLAILLWGLLAGVASSQELATEGPVPATPDSIPPAQQVLNLHLDLPTGARIDYLRMFFHDTSPSSSQAWVTTYNGAGGMADLTNVVSTGAAGYGTTVSPYVGHVVDNLNNAYVLNWRPNQLGASMELCGLRVAYRLPLSGGTWSDFYYVFAAGSTLLPRESAVGWGASSDGGCTYLDVRTYLPLTRKS